MSEKPKKKEIQNHVHKVGSIVKKSMDVIKRNKPSILNYFGLVGLFLIVVIAISVYYSAKDRKTEKQYSANIETLQKEIEWRKTSKYNPKFVDWVYKRSQKNPRQLCKEIVDFTYKNAEYPKTLIALMARESAFNQFAVSKVGAKGLTQIMWKSWSTELIKANLGITEERDLYDWKKSILAGNYILVTLHHQYKGDWKKLLHHYVGGHHATYKDDIFRYIGELSVIEESNPVEVTVDEDVPSVDVAIKKVTTSIETQKQNRL